MKKMLMFVYNDLNSDARVQRSAEAISEIVDLEVLSVGKPFDNLKYMTKNFNSTFKSNIINYFHVFFQVIQYLQGKKYDVLYAHDFSSALFALFIRMTKKCTFLIYDAHELFIPEKGHLLTRRDKFFYWLEKKVIKKADLVISAQEKRGEIMMNHYGLQLRPLTIKNISKLPISENTLESSVLTKSKEFFEKKGITIAYAGVLIEDRKLEYLIRSIANLGDKYKLIFIGKGSDKNRLEQIAQEYKDLTCCFLDSIPYNQLANILQLCDIGYLCYPNDKLNNIYCASNKIYEYASVGLPMIANQNPTVQKIFDTWEIGVCEEDIQKGIKKIVENKENLKKNIIEFNKKNTWEQEALILKQEIIKALQL